MNVEGDGIDLFEKAAAEDDSAVLHSGTLVVLSGFPSDRRKRRRPVGVSPACPWETKTPTMNVVPVGDDRGNGIRLAGGVEAMNDAVSASSRDENGDVVAFSVDDFGRDVACIGAAHEETPEEKAWHPEATPPRTRGAGGRIARGRGRGRGRGSRSERGRASDDADRADARRRAADRRAKKQHEDELRYIGTVLPVIPVDRAPRSFDVSSGESLRLNEYVVGCMGRSTAERDVRDEFGDETPEYVDMLNSLCWGYKDGSTAISVVPSEPGLDVVERLLRGDAVVACRDRRGHEGGKHGDVLFATVGPRDVVGTVTSSETGHVAQYSLTFDRYLRTCKPSGRPMRFRDGGWYDRKADFRVCVVFDAPETRFVETFAKLSDAPMDALHAQTEPGTGSSERVGGAERQLYSGRATFATFAAAVESAGSARRTVALVVTDPMRYGRAETLVARAKERTCSPRKTSGDVAIPGGTRGLERALEAFAIDAKLTAREAADVVKDATPEALVDAVTAAAVSHEGKFSAEAIERTCDLARLCVYADEELSAAPNARPRRCIAREISALIASFVDSVFSVGGDAAEGNWGPVAVLREGMDASAIVGSIVHDMA